MRLEKFISPNHKYPTYVSTIEQVFNKDTNLLESIEVIKQLDENDERHYLNADDYRTELLISSGSVNQLKEIPSLSLNALKMTDMFTNGFNLLNSINNSISNGNS